jgi:hypothetical protein
MEYGNVNVKKYSQMHWCEVSNLTGLLLYEKYNTDLQPYKENFKKIIKLYCKKFWKDWKIESTIIIIIIIIIIVSIHTLGATALGQPWPSL